MFAVTDRVAMTSEAPTNVAASENQIVKHLLVDIGTEARDKLLPTLYGHEPVGTRNQGALGR